MRSLSVRLLLSFFVLILTPALFAHDVTVTGTNSFSSLDGSSSDHDGSANGVFTVNDGNLAVNGTITCNDDVGGGGASACAMAFNVSGNLTVNAGGAIYAENRTAGGAGGNITLTVGGNLSLIGNAIVSSAGRTNSSGNGGAITANVGGNAALGAGSTIDAGTSGNAAAGAVSITAGGLIAVDGNVFSGPSRTLSATRLGPGAALDGGVANASGGAITLFTATFAEPAIVVGSTANIVSQGNNGAAGIITIDGCGVQIKGLVASVSSNSTGFVRLRSGKDILVDGRDLGAAGTRMGRVRADGVSATAANRGVDVFASETIDLFGPLSGHYLLSSNSTSTNGDAGTIRVVAVGEGVNGSGNVADASGSANGSAGGTIDIAAKADASLNTAALRASGDFATGNGNREGGTIRVRSHSGNVVWTNGTGDVRPVGSTSGLAASAQGEIVLTACGSVNTAGTSFPVNGAATSPLPQTQTGVCSPAAPSLPSGTPALITCNTPPVANDTTATTNEDTTVTIFLSGSDADGDSLTFTIVSGPFNGMLGAVISTGPTTATVDYTPNANYNGSDTFTFQANDGNGGTDTATAAITINAVNDPPSFTIGAPVTVFEDSGASAFNNWITNISAGPADEAGQTVTFSVSNSNPSLFSVQPSVDANGNLTFTVAPNQCGSANISVTAQDNGGTANGGNDTSAAQTSSIIITCVNDEPSFTGGPNQTVNEDAGAQTVSPWATGISAGPNESGQALTFFTSNDNNALFSAQPSVSSSGTLTYTPAANANGTATVSVYLMDDGGTANGGDDTSSTYTFTITVNAVNDAPSFTSGGDVTVNEDSGAYSAAWATAISAGPADESGQTLTFSASNDNNALFAVQPSISPSGVLTFTPASNAFGSATVTVTLSDNGGTANGGADTSAAQTFTITVSGVNDEPSFTSGGDVTVNEDSGAYSAAWATAISAGPNESGQTLTFVVSNDNNSLFSAQPSISASGVLTFTPAANAFGSATVSVYLMDDGGTANGGDDTSATQTFTINVSSVNDEPAFTPGGNVTVNEDSGAYSAAWATSISAGPANESGQTVTFFTSNDNNALFAVQPSVSSSGVLTFTPAANASGSATVTVYAQDDGGTANGGDDTSASHTFVITVNGVNDAPSFTPGGNVTVNEDSGNYSAAWATGISAGPNESGQTVTFFTSNDNNALFSTQPSISSTGVLTFTPAANAFGSATVSVYLQDNGGTANGGVDTSGTVTFTITVNGVNDPPTAGNDSWQTIGNTELRVDHGASSTPHISDTTTSGTGVLDNDADNVENDPFSITGVVGCADTTAPFVCAVTGGTVTLEANGSFIFLPSPGAAAGGFQYTVTDQPSAGSPASATGTVSISMLEMVWYVNGNAAAGGTGTSYSPFNSLAPVNSVGDPDDANDYIFVHNSTVAGPIDMEQGQRLRGEGVGLSFIFSINGNPGATSVVPAGPAPTIVSAADTVTVSGVTSVQISGVTLNSTGGNAIDVTGVPFGAATSVNINNITVSGAAAEGIDVNGGNTAGTTATISSSTITSAGHGVNLSAVGTGNVGLTSVTITSTAGNGVNVAATGGGIARVTALTNVTISGATAGSGVVITDGRFDSNANTSGFDGINGGTLTIGSSGNPVGAAAMTLTNVSGDYSLTNLNAFGSTDGVVITGTGLFVSPSTGMRFAVTTAGTVSAANGVGLSVSNAQIAAAGIKLTKISASGGVNGILLNNTGTLNGLTVSGDGTGAANASGGLIQNTTGAGVSLSSTRASLTQLNLVNTGGHGIDASSVTAFVYQDASVINAGNANEEHSIKLLNVFGTSLIEDVTLDDINEDGIEVRQNLTDDATADSLTIRRLNVQDHQAGFGEAGIEIQADAASNFTVLVDDSDFAINGNAVMGLAVSTASTHTGTFTLTAQNNVFNAAGAFGAGSLQILGGGSGTVTYNVTGNTVTGAKFDGIRVNNEDTQTTSATISNNTVTGTGATNNGEGISVRQDGDGSMTLTVSGNNVTGFVSHAIHLNSNDALIDDGGIELSATVTNNTGTVDPNGLGAGLFVDVGDGSGIAKNDVCLNVSGNNLSGTEAFEFFDYDITLQLLETADASLRVTQASAAALSSANNSATVSVFENPPNTVTFNGGTCATP
jgi:Bacterial Ig domain